MKRILLEGPAVEPVLVAEMKAHLRLDGDEEDDLLGALIVGEVGDETIGHGRAALLGGCVVGTGPAVTIAARCAGR